MYKKKALILSMTCSILALSAPVANGNWFTDFIRDTVGTICGPIVNKTGEQFGAGVANEFKDAIFTVFDAKLTPPPLSQ